MKTKALLVLVVLILLGAVIWVVLFSGGTKKSGSIELRLTPGSYCPESAQIMLVDQTDARIVFDGETGIEFCQQISLASLPILQNNSYKAYVKPPKALAFSINIDSSTGSYAFAPVLGDANDDNVIDNLDRRSVEALLLNASPTKEELSSGDIDQDKRITVFDLSLTKLNQQIGQARPDGKQWNEI